MLVLYCFLGALILAALFGFVKMLINISNNKSL